MHALVPQRRTGIAMPGFALAPRDFAAQETGGHLTALSLNPPGFVPLDVVWIPGNPAADEVLAILWDITDDRRADHAAAT